MSVDRFYREFEAAFRGDRAEITARLEVYNEFVSPLLTVSSSRKALDLGCGRGEWLELMKRIGFNPHGVDLDAGMLQDCFDRGLSAEQGDAIAYLQAQPDDSHAVVSGFHIAEHLPFELLQELVRQALRVLEPAGLLILETPNPENIRVGSMTFHMDPTHNKPLPPGLLTFLARHYGFGRAKVLRLQESSALREAQVASLIQVFEGVSPDYSVVAQKQADADVWSMFDAAFASDRGLTLETLAERFEAGVVNKRDLDQLHVEVSDLKALCDSMQLQIDRLSYAVENSQSEADQLRREIHALRGELDKRLHEIRISTSWRVTAPLRLISRVVHAIRARVLAQRIKDKLRPHAFSLALAVHKRPRLRRFVLTTLRRAPGLEARLRSALTITQRSDVTLNRRHGSPQLTPRGRRIYEKLNKLQDL